MYWSKMCVELEFWTSINKFFVDDEEWLCYDQTWIGIGMKNMIIIGIECIDSDLNYLANLLTNQRLIYMKKV